MKKIFTKYTLTLLSLFIILIASIANLTTGTDTGGKHGLMSSSGIWSNSGSPGDGATCTECHSDGGTGVENTWISTDIPGTEYQSGATYTITLTADSGAASKGFSIVCEDSSDVPVGTFASPDANTAPFSNHVSHTAAGNTLSTWSFDWTAPAAGAGNVTFYAAFLIDGDYGVSGDVITASSAFTEGTVSISDPIFKPALAVYPNPVSDFLHLKIKEVSNGSVAIYSITGQKVISEEIETSGSEFSKTLDLTDLNTGTYFVKVSNNDNVYTKKIIVK